MVDVRANDRPVYSSPRARSFWQWLFAPPVTTDEETLVNYTHLYQPCLHIHADKVRRPNHPVAELAVIPDAKLRCVTLLAVYKDGTERKAHMRMAELQKPKLFYARLEEICPP